MLHRRLSFARNIQLVPLLFKLLCLIGLFWQLLDISSEYFKYKVDILTTVTIPDEVQNLSMAICLPIRFVFDFEKFNTKLEFNWTPDEFDRQDMIRNLSINEIYNYTYDADNIVYQVNYHNSYWHALVSKTNLSSLMKLQKYFFSYKICYLYSVRYFEPLSIKQLRGSSIASILFSKEISEIPSFLLFLQRKIKFHSERRLKRDICSEATPP